MSEIAVFGPRERYVYPPKNNGVFQYNYANSLFSYVGEWKDGRKHGRGKFTIGKGSFYEGDFEKGEMTGNGRRVFANGSTYEGQFSLGEFCGQGKFVDAATSEVYVGEWKDNKRSGEGELSYPDATKYVGCFANHKRHGFGKYTSVDGDQYEGMWVNDSIEGKGKMIYKIGDVYEGDFFGGKKHGMGTMKWAEGGLSVSCEWKEDKCLYNPTGFVVPELPAFTPGTTLPNIDIRVEGGDGESGRIIQVQIEIGKFDPTAVLKKTIKPKKSETADKEPKFFILNSSTQETEIKITTENGSATIPPISIPIDTEPNTFTLIIEDLSEKATLPQITADFNFVPSGITNQVTEKQPAKVKQTIKKPAAKPPRRK